MVAVIEWAHRLPVADASLRIDVKDLLAAISLPHGRQVDRRDSRRGRGDLGTILPRAPACPRSVADGGVAAGRPDLGALDRSAPTGSRGPDGHGPVRPGADRTVEAREIPRRFAS